MRDVIVINRMYNGEYLVQDNLGHEIINLYCSDNGNNYIYLQPLGTYAPKWLGRVELILMVRSIEKRGVFEILGIAEGLEEVYNPTQKSQQDKIQLDYIKSNNVTYGGTLLSEMFMENSFQQSICISYKAKKVKFPSKHLYLCYNENDIDTNSDNYFIFREHNQPRQSLKQYIEPSNSNNDDNTRLRSWLDNKDFWSTAQPQKVSLIDDGIGSNSYKTTFFDICKVEYSELAYSNALAFFMEKYPHLVISFAKEVLKINPIIDANFKITREENNIDLLLKSGDNWIIIENKIRSGINGLNNSGYDSQLDKYLDYVIKNRKNVNAYILTPNYNDLDYSKYDKDNKYTKLFYSQIYDFLKLQKEYIEGTDYHFCDFVDSLQRHSQSHDNDLYYKMLDLFQKRIRKTKI